ncbi:glutathione-disulfide reductase [Saccharophagus degradans]|uniref:Glutathione-disulfide reductase n=1 Tax=Saccharophagus degradans TaxID=86304 RepID=A0AAW7X1H2_9GAMM|nr:glutathione-disulfide reductase [Saccharophagus degradans]MDO6421334.1 glutathione-disulfide reductase [Saccharophagus degradans]MDO6605755.1 glutathione-disulfide reductase [Saccharophagus degradans]
MTFDYDFFVIGAGSGGVRASRIAAGLGAKVAVAEDTFMGGTCVNVGCVPKKLFVYASEFAEHFEAAKGFGWQQVDSSFDWPTLRDNKTKEIERLNGIYERMLGGANVEVIHGRATLLGNNKVSVGDKVVTAKHILIATGGTPKWPTFEGAEHCITSDQIFYLDTLPKRVLVQGGGYIAVEFAGILNGLGCATELAYRGPLFLRGFDSEVREFVATQMAEKGVQLSFNTDIESIAKNDDGSLTVKLNNGDVREVDAVLSAIGREPRINGLGLENTQVKTAKNGFIEVDNNFLTADPSIYAVGDVVGRMPLTPVALAEGMALARYLFDKKPIELNYSNIPTAVFCQPNIATVGLTQQQAEEQFGEVLVFKSDFKALKHTLSGLAERTLMKLIVDKNSNKVVGCHMVGPDAAEIMQGIAIAIVAGATKQDFDNTIGIHPSAAEEFVTMRSPV